MKANEAPKTWEDAVKAQYLRMDPNGDVWDIYDRLYPTLGDLGTYVNPPNRPGFGTKKGDTLRVNVHWSNTNAGRVVGQCTFHYLVQSITGTPSIDEVTPDLCEGILDTMKTNDGVGGIFHMYPSWMRIGDCDVQSITTVTEGAKDSQFLTGAANANAVMEPGRVAMVCHRGTAQGGRSGHGRIYLPAMAAGSQNSGEIASTGIGHLKNTLGKLLSITGKKAGLSARYQHVLYSAKKSANARAIVAYPVTSFYPRLITGTQRRRQAVSS